MPLVVAALTGGAMLAFALELLNARRDRTRISARRTGSTAPHRDSPVADLAAWATFDACAIRATAPRD